MQFTHTVTRDTLIGFYEGEKLAAAFHQDDLTFEWKQLHFLLQEANKKVDFEALEWYDDNRIIVSGLDSHEAIDLDCKLINYQFGSKIPLERHLKLGEK